MEEFLNLYFLSFLVEKILKYNPLITRHFATKMRVF